MLQSVMCCYPLNCCGLWPESAASVDNANTDFIPELTVVGAVGRWILQHFGVRDHLVVGPC